MPWTQYSRETQRYWVSARATVAEAAHRCPKSRDGRCRSAPNSHHPLRYAFSYGGFSYAAASVAVLRLRFQHRFIFFANISGKTNPFISRFLLVQNDRVWTRFNLLTEGLTRFFYIVSFLPLLSLCWRMFVTFLCGRRTPYWLVYVWLSVALFQGGREPSWRGKLLRCGGNWGHCWGVSSRHSLTVTSGDIYAN